LPKGFAASPRLLKQKKAEIYSRKVPEKYKKNNREKAQKSQNYFFVVF
jgi:hypothetical protein